MAFPQDITLDTSVYSLTVQRPTSSVRSVASLPTGKDEILQISHETSKDGRRSSVFILEDNVVLECDANACSPKSTRSTCKLMLKLQYNPLDGNSNQAAAIADLRAQMQLLIDDNTLWPKFLNLES